MEAFGRYVAGPRALASLAWNAWNSNEAAGVVLWCLAATWAVAAVLAWRRERRGLWSRSGSQGSAAATESGRLALVAGSEGT